MKILVTGGCGFIGSNLVDRVCAEGHEVTVMDAECADNEVFYKNAKAKHIKADILDTEALRSAMQGAEKVFHFAAESRIGPAIENPRRATEVNVVGTCNVLQVARELGVKGVVYSSTSACYGLKNPSPMHEEMPFDNLNPYSTSKIAGEDLCRMFSSLYGLPTVSLRYFNVFGDRMPTKGQYAPVLGIFLRQVKAGQPVTVVGDGEQRRDFVHVSDVVQANLLAAAAAEQRSGRVYNVGSGSNVSVLDLAKLFPGKREHLPARAGEARNTCASLDRIKSELGYAPKISVVPWLTELLHKEGIL